MYDMLLAGITGFTVGGAFFYWYGKKMALDLHYQYTHGDYSLDMTCEEADRYERQRSHLGKSPADDAEKL